MLTHKKQIRRTASPQDRILLTDLRTQCIIGIFDWERKKKQAVSIDLEIPCSTREAAKTDRIEKALDYKQVAKAVLQTVGTSRYFLIETLAEAVAQTVFESSKAHEVVVTVSKPKAVRHAKNVAVKITRLRNQTKKALDQEEQVYLSLGSNIRPAQMIPQCLEALAKSFKIIRSSKTYQSRAWGKPKKSVAPFWNLIVEIQTTLPPKALKEKLHDIEKQFGRKRTQDKFAPRTIDVDIVYYGSNISRSKSNPIPHPDAITAPHVLLPMLELDPHFVHPTAKQSMIELMAKRFDPQSQFKTVKPL